MPLALECAGVRVRYGGIEVLHGVRLALAYGTFSALVGPNGAGKTTLLDWCAGAATPATGTAGTLWLDGRTAGSWSVERRARAGLRYVPFEANVFAGLSVRDNLRATSSAFTRAAKAATRSARMSEPSGRIGVASPPARLSSISAVFEVFPELARLADRSAGVLSGGERQLLAVAGALSGGARILLLDEPTHGLAPELAERVLAELARAAKEDGRAVLVTDPVAEKAAAHADFLWPLDRGLRLASPSG